MDVDELWSPRMSLGSAVIDDHHKKLLRLVVETRFLAEGAKDRHRIMAVLSELVGYTKYHFAAEERLMAECRFPDIEPHIEDHQKFLQYLDATLSRFNARPEELSHDVYLFLRDWYVEHIVKKDLMIAAHLGRGA
jgi:hemerythrin